MSQSSYYHLGASIFSAHGRLDPWSWAWEAAERPADASPISALDALRVLGGNGSARRLPVGVIGPRDATQEQYEGARAVGTALGKLGLTMICGGKSGVMEAAARGCYEAGGLTVGLLPDHDWRAANPFIALPIATGLSEARNMIIAKSCLVLIAIGGSYGTLSEIAYSLHFSKPVIGLFGAPHIEGMQQAETVEDAVNLMAGYFLESATLS